MKNRAITKCIIAAAIICFTAFSSRAGTEYMVNSLVGSNITTTGLTTQEQFYPTATGSVKSSVANAYLHFDDSKRTYYSAFWKVIVTYNITVYDQAGASTSTSGEVLEVNFHPTSNYTDKALRTYSNTHKATITITNVEYKDISGNPIGGSLPTDVYLDLEIFTERFYSLNTAAAPTITTANGFSTSNPANNELALTWTYQQGAESYDLEWLFIDAGQSFASGGYAYDFKNATRINTRDNKYNIPLAFPQGWVLYRVRAIGVNTTNFTDRVESVWSYNTTSGSSTNSVSDKYQYINTNTCLSASKELNWQYSAAFAEDGKRKDVVSYFDGSLRNRQSLTILNTDNNAIIGETKYDYEGRGSVQILPTPVTTQGIRYYNNFNPSFSRLDFDKNSNVTSPGTLSTTSGAGKYYSSSNSNLTGVNAYIPDASGYGYSRTWLMNDGTGRVRSQSGVGPTHKLGSGHETKYFYGTTTQRQVDRLFGNEVGYSNHYKKNMVVDPNGQVAVSYLDEHGRVIATALAGPNPSNLLAIDAKKPSAQAMTDDLLTTNALSQGDEMVAVNTITVPATGVYTFSYDLDPNEHCDECQPEGPGCPDCKYDLEISIKDQDGNLVTGGTNPITATNISSGTYTFSYTLPVGVYTVVKTLKLNAGSLDAYRAAFIDYHRDLGDESECVPKPAVTTPPCDDCEQLCLEMYTKKDENGEILRDEEDHILYFTQDGEEMTEEEGEAAVLACQKATCTPTPPDPCVLTRNAMIADVSPGGQYFDNTPAMYTAGATLFDDVHTNTSYSGGDINDWLNTNVRDESASGFTAWFDSFVGGTNNMDDWDEVRANWNTAWAESLLTRHPEYCAYKYFCDPTCTAYDAFGQPYTVSKREAYYDYETRMQESDGSGGDAELFNPLAMTYSVTTTGKYGDNSTYQFCNATITNKDPYFDAPCDTFICTGGARHRSDVIKDILKRFVPVYDNTGTFTGNYYSLWYLLDDPDGIASCTSCSLHTSIVDAFKEIQAELTATTITKFQYFRTFYNFLKKVIEAKGFEHIACYPNTTTPPNAPPVPSYTNGYLTLVDRNGSLDAGGYNVHFPENPVYKHYRAQICNTIDNSFFSAIISSVTDAVTNSSTGIVAVNCDKACRENAELWMGKLGNCLSSGLLAEVKQYLIDICKASCDTANPMGLDNVSGGVSGPKGTMYSFQGVIDYYNTNHSGTCIYVHNPEGYNRAICSCDNLYSIIKENGLSATNYTGIAAAVNEALQPATAYTATEVQAWLGECDNFSPSVSVLNTNNFPAEMLCPEDEPDLTGGASLETFEDECEDENQVLAQYNADEVYERRLLAAADAYMAAIRATCLNLTGKETFTVSYELDEYQYTLYYYDQADNLIKTVPPEGVNVITNSTTLTNVHTYRTTGSGSFIYPSHTMITHYKHNSLQQVVEQSTPDGGTTEFWYDALKRLVASQNDKQAAYGTPAYSYTLYDALGRLYEVGEDDNGTALTASTASDASAFYTWVATGTRNEVTKTYYDEEGCSPVTGVTQSNLRNRISQVSFQETYNASACTYDNATYYDYDIHGNVKTLYQHSKTLMTTPTLVKIDYVYDLISGNVNEVHYQDASQEQFHHRYFYDADNRLTAAYTSSDGKIYTKDCKYFYYPHGPLARTETGDKQVQGTDYAYTIHGLIKGVNSNTLVASREPGKDGSYSSTNLNGNFGLDAAGYTLGYYDSDYTPISSSVWGSSDRLEASIGTGNFANGAPSLYNGNIRHMVTALTKTDETQMTVHGMAYNYDQLNRIRTSELYKDANILSTNNWNSSASSTDYYEAYHYDANGNITSLERNGYAGSGNLTMDDLGYNYTTNTNKLEFIDDGVSSGNYTVDVDDQSSGNYTYDNIGNLISDAQENIATIDWTAYGKVWKITRTSGCSTKVDLEFRYDAMGNRTEKISKPRPGGNPSSATDWTTTYYARDARGNILATYTKTYDVGSSTYKLKLTDSEVYGNNRLGTLTREVDLSVTPSPTNLYTRILGNKQYELSNHLGNVLETVSDRKFSVGSGSAVSYYNADVISATDYYNFGMQMPGREFNTTNCRFGYNGMEKDDEVKGAGNSYFAAFRGYDSRTGRWSSIDPVDKAFISPYAAMSDNPILRVDPDGDNDYTFYADGTWDVVHTDKKHTFTVITTAGLVTYQGVRAAVVDAHKVTFQKLFIEDTELTEDMMFGLTKPYEQIESIKDALPYKSKFSNMVEYAIEESKLDEATRGFNDFTSPENILLELFGVRALGYVGGIIGTQIERVSFLKNVWAQGFKMRGEILESLARYEKYTTAKGYTWLRSIGKNFPGIDFLKGTAGVSYKTVAATTKGFGKIKSNILQLNRMIREGGVSYKKVWYDVTSAEIEVGYQPGFDPNKLNSLVEYGKTMGIKVHLKEIK